MHVKRARSNHGSLAMIIASARCRAMTLLLCLAALAVGAARPVRGQAPNTSQSTASIGPLQAGATNCYNSVTQTGSSSASCPPSSFNNLTGSSATSSDNATRTATATTQLSKSGTTAGAFVDAWSNQYSAITGVSTPSGSDAVFFHFLTSGSLSNSGAVTATTYSQQYLQVAGGGGSAYAQQILFGGSSTPTHNYYGGATPTAGGYDLSLTLTQTSPGVFAFMFQALTESYMDGSGGTSSASTTGTLNATLQGLDVRHADGTTYATGVYDPTAGTWSLVDVTTTPEPSSFALLGTGIIGLVPLARRKR